MNRRRHGATRTQRSHRAVKEARRRAQDLRHVHRAFDGCRVRLMRTASWSCARPADWDGNAGSDPHNAEVQQSTSAPARRLRRVRNPCVSAPILEVTSLNAWYGAAQILFDLSFQVGRGEVVALRAARPGKTTTIEAIMGLVARAAAACVLRRGHCHTAAVRDRPPRAGFRARGPRIFSDLTVLENLARPAAAAGVSRRRERTVLTLKSCSRSSQSGRDADRRGGNLSAGQQMLTVARTLMAIRCWSCSTSRPKGGARSSRADGANTIVD